MDKRIRGGVSKKRTLYLVKRVRDLFSISVLNYTFQGAFLRPIDQFWLSTTIRYEHCQARSRFLVCFGFPINRLLAGRRSSKTRGGSLGALKNV
jgi:hypothetical protein